MKAALCVVSFHSALCLRGRLYIPTTLRRMPELLPLPSYCYDLETPLVQPIFIHFSTLHLVIENSQCS